MIPVEDAQALYAEAKALRAEVREVVAILEDWTQTATVTTRSEEVRGLPAASVKGEQSRRKETWNRLLMGSGMTRRRQQR